jgi:hypothetical protein
LLFMALPAFFVGRLGLIEITRGKVRRAYLGHPPIYQPIIRQYLPRCKAPGAMQPVRAPPDGQRQDGYASLPICADSRQGDGQV